MITLAAWVVFALLPGASIAVLVMPAIWRRPVLLAATAPAITFAFTAVVGSALQALGIGPWPSLVGLGALVVLAAALRLARYLRADAAVPSADGTAGRAAVARADDSADRSDLRLAHWLLIAAIALGAVAWLVPERPSVPLNRDIQNHAYFVARIADENSVDPAVALAESPARPDPVASFYPLAAHTTVAMAHRATGAPIADLLITWPLLAAVLTLPCGLFVLARRLVPDRPGVAGFAALAGACTAVFPYQPMSWGGVAFLVAMSLVPGSLALALEAVDSGRTAPRLLAALAVAGTVFVHTSELALFVVVLGAFAVADLLGARRNGTIRPTVTGYSVLAGLCALLILPLLVGVAAGGASERSSIAETRDEGVLDVVARLVTFDIDEGPAQPVMGVLALAGIALVIVRRSDRPMGRIGALLLALGALALLFASATMTGPVWDQLRVATVPWYRSWWRLMYNVALFAPLFVGFGLDEFRLWFQQRTSRSPVLVGSAVAVLAVVLVRPPVWPTLSSAGIRGPAFQPGELALIDDLAGRLADDGGQDRTPTGGAVLNQENDATSWMYMLAGLPAFSGVQGVVDGADADDRDYLLDHIDEAAVNPRVQRLLGRWGIRYVLVGGGTYSGERAVMTPTELQAAEGFRLLDHRGLFWLFEVPTRA